MLDGTGYKGIVWQLTAMAIAINLLCEGCKYLEYDIHGALQATMLVTPTQIRPVTYLEQLDKPMFIYLNTKITYK